jgi:hypothetical protein
MVRRLALALAIAAAGCVSRPVDLRARIADDVTLTLPTPPAYPDTRTIVQIGHAQYGERQAAFEAILSLAPERTEIVITMLGGPRLTTVTWTASGVHEQRTPLAPANVPVENILADIFVAEWPAAAVAAALPSGVELNVTADGAREIRRGDALIVSVTHDAADPSRMMVRNLVLGYEVSIVDQRQD